MPFNGIKIKRSHHTSRIERFYETADQIGVSWYIGGAVIVACVFAMLILGLHHILYF